MASEEAKNTAEKGKVDRFRNRRKNSASTGFRLWFFASTRRWGFMCMFAAIATVSLSVASRQPHWFLYLVGECAAVGVGVSAGWCWVKYDRAKMTRPINVKDDDIDRLGFFNSRVAMRSLTLFKITIADYPIEKEQKDKVIALVERYWRKVEAADIRLPEPPASPKGGTDPESTSGSGSAPRSGSSGGAGIVQPQHSHARDHLFLAGSG